jgi:hypothetical protein
MKITEHNVETGEIIEREMTTDEVKAMQSEKATLEAHLAELAAKETARQSALDKLAALGLTPEEIAALS